MDKENIIRMYLFHFRILHYNSIKHLDKIGYNEEIRIQKLLMHRARLELK